MTAADDPLIVWAAEAGGPGVRVRRHRGAIAVAATDLARRDRIVVQGGVDDVTVLLRDVLAEVGPGYRPLGDEALIGAVAERLPVLTSVGRFGWMDVTAPVEAPAVGRPHWLADPADVAGLLAEAAPDSYAWPGRAGVRRWAGTASTGR